MIQRNGPQDDWKVRMSHFPLHVHPFIIWALYRWEPVDALSGIGLFELPSNHFDIASHLLYVKTAQRAIWLWVMEGGLNSPSEILEPVGKPQLFKCRKSWFYKMLIWSALGSRKRTPLPDPTSISLVEWRKGAKEKIVAKRREGIKKGRNKRRRRTNYYLIHLQTF